MAQLKSPGKTPTLSRRLTLTHLVLYGLGVTVGAGIYVLVGLTVAEAGIFAPISFLLAALVVAFTALTYSELSTRFPVSAGEAVYVNEGLKSKSLALAVGLLVAASDVVSAAAISIGAAAYMTHLIPVSSMLLTIIIIVVLGLAAAWGILESVTFAAILTVLEIIGLAGVVFYGVSLKPDLLKDIGTLVPPFELAAWSGIASAGLLAFFAFIGFEDLANVAEEAKSPKTNMPRAIVLTLICATAIYLVVVSVVVLSVPLEKLRVSASPLMLVFDQASDTTKGTFNLIAAFATINGVLVQMIMASRILYGLASKGHLPKRLAYIHPVTRTPLIATALIVAIILVLALFLPIGRLAEMTSQIALIVFAFVNLALIRIKVANRPVQGEFFEVPLWVPVLGFITCMLLLISGFI